MYCSLELDMFFTRSHFFIIINKIIIKSPSKSMFMATVSKFWVGKIENFRHKYMVKVLGSGLRTPPNFYGSTPAGVTRCCGFEKSSPFQSHRFTATCLWLCLLNEMQGRVQIQIMITHLLKHGTERQD